MNRHFEDTRYYLKRATETAKRGVGEELAPVRERVAALTGDEEPEPGRLEGIRAHLRDLTVRADGEARAAVADARERLGAYREGRAN